MSVTCIFSGRTHKKNENINDCQDCFQINEEEGCFAIADGSSQSFYPNIWASLLVEEFCKNPQIDKDNWQSWLQPIQKGWLEEVKKRVEKAISENSYIWVTNKNRLNKRESGTSTFIGLQFIDDQVNVSIVGDSCLFIIESHKDKDDYKFKSYLLNSSHLLNSSQDFNDQPDYFASYSKDNNFPPDCFVRFLEKKTTFDEKLYFILATDALSEYIFQSIENKEIIFGKLIKIRSQEAFENFVASARSADTIKMKNDDVALLILEVTDRKLGKSPLPSMEGKTENTGVQPTENDEIKNSNPEQDPDLIKHSTPLKGFSSFWYCFNLLVNINKSLQLQRFLLGVVVISLSLFMGVDKIFFDQTTDSTSDRPKTQNTVKPSTITNESSVTITTIEPKFIKLKQGIRIYKDKELQEIILDSLSNSFEVLIIEEEDQWIKFQIDLYAYESVVNKCDSCQDDEIEIKPNDNIRTLPMFPKDNNNNIFGQLKEKSKFKKTRI